MKTISSLLCVLLTACAATLSEPPPEKADAIPVAVVASGMPAPEVLTLLAETGSILGYPLELTKSPDYEYGAVTVVLHDASPPNVGFALVTRGCRRALWSEPRPQVLAHELGHVFGLIHVMDPTNLMFPAEMFESHDLTPKQRETLDRGIADLHACTAMGPR